MSWDLGVMQGRLLPKFEGRYQAHPVGYWQQEFDIAAGEGLRYIEFILDRDRVELNPLWSAAGRGELRHVIKASGVGVQAICADYFLEEPVWLSSESAEALPRVLEAAAEIGAGVVVMPVLEKASIPGPDALRRLEEVIHDALKEVPGPRIALETELSPMATAELLKGFDPRVGIAYDTGNHAAAGFSATSDWAAYGDRVIHVHLKDRKVGGGSVHLGEGDVDFGGLIQSMEACDYSGALTIQGFRDDEGVAVFRSQMAYLNTLIPQTVTSA